MRSQVKPDERSNGHAHVKAFLLGDSEAIPVARGRMNPGRTPKHLFRGTRRGPEAPGNHSSHRGVRQLTDLEGGEYC